MDLSYRNDVELELLAVYEPDWLPLFCLLVFAFLFAIYFFGWV